jgi:GDP-L-fucose synthase
MQKPDLIYVAGHCGLVGSALVRALGTAGYRNLLLRTRFQLDLRDQSAVRHFFRSTRPDHVFLAAARVGGILANATRPGEFIADNLAIQSNVIGAAREFGTRRLLFLGSSCIYPRDAPQPMSERCLLSGPLETTNRAYAVAKIAGIELCRAFHRQYGMRCLAVMPANLYGPWDHDDAERAHVIPALVRKVLEAKRRGRPEVVVWGTGRALREFLHSDDLAAACLLLMQLPDKEFDRLLADDGIAPLVNVGSGKEISIAELAALVAELAGYGGRLAFDRSRPDGTPRKLLDSSRIAVLGWRPKVTLREGLAKLLAAAEQEVKLAEEPVPQTSPASAPHPSPFPR